jgi:hypothetical protein
MLVLLISSDRLGAGRPGFDSWQGQDFSFLHSVQTASGPNQRQAHLSPPSSAEARTVELYLHSPVRLHGVVLNN